MSLVPGRTRDFKAVPQRHRKHWKNILLSFTFHILIRIDRIEIRLKIGSYPVKDISFHAEVVISGLKGVGPKSKRFISHISVQQSEFSQIDITVLTVFAYIGWGTCLCPNHMHTFPMQHMLYTTYIVMLQTYLKIGFVKRNTNNFKSSFQGF